MQSCACKMMKTRINPRGGANFMGITKSFFCQFWVRKQNYSELIICNCLLLIINPLEDQTWKWNGGTAGRDAALRGTETESAWTPGCFPFSHPETGATKACVCAPLSPDPLASITPRLIYSKLANLHNSLAQLQFWYLLCVPIETGSLQSHISNNELCGDWRGLFLAGWRLHPQRSGQAINHVFHDLLVWFPYCLFIL